MTRHFRKSVPFALTIAALTMNPAPAAASSCTRDYMKCLNDTHDLSGFFEYLANLECGLKLANCLKTVVAG